MPSPRDIAESFSLHRFDEALAHIADDAVWTLVGADVLRGREAIAAACRATEDDLAGGTSEFLRVEVIDGGDLVAVDTLTAYTDAEGGAGAVSSCDVYRFEEGRVVALRSYTVEVSGDEALGAA